MVVTFYGVRGSIPVPGASTLRYGGNTSCVHLKLNCGHDLVLDAGTGIRELGYVLQASSNPVQILLSHNHWDHIQGFPFFNPLYQRGRHIDLFPYKGDNHFLLFTLVNQMDGASFPVHVDDLPAELNCETEDPQTFFQADGVKISRCPLNHPGGGHALRLDEEGKSVAYVTDNELEPPDHATTSYEQWVKFCHKVDLLIHDAQYVEADLPHKYGWGHSLVSQTRQLAMDAEVGTLALFHHDPERTDRELDRFQRETAEFFKAHRVPINSCCAREGLVLDLEK